MDIIDRRLNPSGKSFANRQRFLKRAKALVAAAVREASGGRAIADFDGPAEIPVSAKGVREPIFRHDAGDREDYILPGNQTYVEGDRIERPQMSANGTPANVGRGESGEDDFAFTLTREEFLDAFLSDLELPNLAKRRLIGADRVESRRAGYSKTGTPARLALGRTMQVSLARRRALGRPRRDAIEEAERGAEDQSQTSVELRRAATELATLHARRDRVAYLDPLDLRYKRFERTPHPVAQAVMFCLMDVSGSMTEHMKDLAKRFYILLHVFLRRCYQRVDIVFIRHTDHAAEVDEETFFYSRETGGTIVSSALDEMLKIVTTRYDPSSWNIYAAQASDGDNTASDCEPAVEALRTAILPICQYFAYIETRAPDSEALGLASTEMQSALWRSYSTVAEGDPKLQMRRVAHAAHIFPVFRELFAKRLVNRTEGGS